MTQKKKVEQKKVEGRRTPWWRIALWWLGLAVWVGVAVIASELLVGKILVLILPADLLKSNVVTTVYNFLGYAASMIVTIGVPWWLLKKKTTRDELGLRGLPTWTDLLLAPAGFIVTLILGAILTLVMMAILPQINWQQTQNVGFHALYQFHEYILAFVCLVVLAPICEEIIFRGWLYGKLRVKMPAIPAILIVSTLFGIMHFQWNVGVSVFAMSLGMCFMRELTGTIWSGVILHMIKNGIAFYALFVLM